MLVIFPHLKSGITQIHSRFLSNVLDFNKQGWIALKGLKILIRIARGYRMPEFSHHARLSQKI